jgi:hypothetical protein
MVWQYPVGRKTNYGLVLFEDGQAIVGFKYDPIYLQ